MFCIPWVVNPYLCLPPKDLKHNINNLNTALVTLTTNMIEKLT